MLGHAGGAPLVSQEGKQPFALLSLATNKSWKDKEGNTQEQVAWHKVLFFGKAAEFIEAHVKSGSRLYIEGELEYQQWKDNEGKERCETQIIARGWPILLDKPVSANAETNNLN